MNKLRVEYLLVIVLVSCLSASEKATNKMFVDSLFYKTNVHEFYEDDIRDFSKNNLEGYRVQESLIDELRAFDKSLSKVTYAYYYSNYTMPKGSNNIAILIETTSDKFLALVTFSGNGISISSLIRLTEDHCDLVNQDNEKEEIWCDSRISRLIDVNTLQTITRHEKRFEYGSKSTGKIDSIVTMYDYLGDRFEFKKKDSIRIIY